MAKEIGFVFDHSTFGYRVIGNPDLDPETSWGCLLYTSDAADERSSVDLGGRRIIKKKTKEPQNAQTPLSNTSQKTT